MSSKDTNTHTEVVHKDRDEASYVRVEAGSKGAEAEEIGEEFSGSAAEMTFGSAEFQPGESGSHDASAMEGGRPADGSEKDKQGDPIPHNGGSEDDKLKADR